MYVFNFHYGPKILQLIQLRSEDQGRSQKLALIEKKCYKEQLVLAERLSFKRDGEINP